MKRRRLAATLAAVILAAVAAALSPAIAVSGAAPARAATAHAKRASKGPELFISLGDSYAVGYMGALGHTTLNGPANQLVGLAAKRGYSLKLVNLGCGGATTTSMITQLGCPAAGLAPNAANYPGKTQVQAAVDLIRSHRGHVGLVTISIGGNDIDGCIPLADPLTCVAHNMPAAIANLTRAVKRLRAAGGPSMRIIGSTYPDVVLGAWVRPDIFGANRFTLATESLTAFSSLINPGLRKAYNSVGASFVDVTAATGAYGPFVTTNDPTYGTIPKPVAEVCRLTDFCTRLDIHMTTAGYHIIASLEAATLPRIRR